MFLLLVGSAHGADGTTAKLRLVPTLLAVLFVCLQLVGRLHVWCFELVCLCVVGGVPVTGPVGQMHVVVAFAGLVQTCLLH